MKFRSGQGQYSIYNKTIVPIVPIFAFISSLACAWGMTWGDAVGMRSYNGRMSKWSTEFVGKVLLATRFLLIEISL